MHAGDIYIDVYMSVPVIMQQVMGLIAIHVQMTLYTAHTCTHVKLTRALDTHTVCHACLSSTQGVITTIE